MNPSVNCGLWDNDVAICVGSSGVTNVLLGNADITGAGRALSGDVSGEAGSVWELPVLFIQFCCEPEIALKSKLFFVGLFIF